jgi:flagellar hook-length control protein FliK
MTDLFIKTGATNDQATQTPNGRDNASALAGLAGSFQDLIHKAGARIEDGFSALTGRSGILGSADKVEPPRPAENSRRDNSSDSRDYADNRAEYDDRTGDLRADRDDGSYGRDFGHDQGGEYRDDRTGAAATERGESRTDAPADDDEGGDPQTAATKGENDDATGESGKENEAAEGQTDTQDADGQTAGNTAPDGQTAATGEALSTVLSELMAGGQALGENGVAAEQGKVSSSDGIATASQNIAASSAAQQVSSKTASGPDTTANGNANQAANQSQGAVNADTRAKTVANAHSAVASEDGDEGPQSTRTNQASTIAKAIGAGNRAQVSVTVTNESQNLTSRPGAALATNAVAAAEASNQSSSGQQAQTGNGSNQTPVSQTLQNQADAGQSQAAQAAVAQAVQAGSAKGLAQAQTVTTTSGSGVHAGGEGVSQTGGVTAAQQTQQSQAQTAAEQAKSTDKPAPTGRTIVEQISVKVTKALEAGTDKIVIQLRPANMGRVEVKLEMVQDNRVSVLVVADNRETLDTLKNDSRELQRALLEAGLSADSGDLNFSLRGEENQGQDGKGSSGQPLTGEEDIAELEEMIIEEAIIASDGRVLSNGRIDVRA